MVRNLTKQNWSIHYGWVKAHAGIEGNEVADTLAKEAAKDDEDRNIVYDRIPISTIATRIKEEGLKNGKRNGEGQRMERYVDFFFSNGRAEAKNTNSNNSRAHGNGQRSRDDKNLLHRFNLTDDPMCPCNEGEQTVEHLIYICRIL